MATKKRPNVQRLGEYAGTVRAEVKAIDQQKVFHAAIEAGYLAATTDGTLDDEERQALVKAIGLLSAESVIEWEVESVLDACAGDTSDAESRATAVAEKLKSSGHAEAGVLVAAFVAQATSGIDKKEEKILKSIAKQAGITDKRARELLKSVGAEATIQ